MKLEFLELPSDERRLHIEQAALTRNVDPVVLEKDFWVCFPRIGSVRPSRTALEAAVDGAPCASEAECVPMGAAAGRLRPTGRAPIGHTQHRPRAQYKIGRAEPGM